jgi:hypothetical protein
MKLSRLGVFFLVSGLFALTGDCSAATVSWNAQGTWRGAASDGKSQIKLEFAFTDSSSGALTGTMKIGDPKTGNMVALGTVKGSLSGTEAEWTSLGGLRVTGTFSGNKFSGKAVFPGALDVGPLSTSLLLTR